MEPIRVRNPRGEERTFTSPDELGRAIAQGTITPEWAVYESTSGQWSQVSGTEPPMTAAPAPVARRTREVVLIYPTEAATPVRNTGADAGTDPLDLVSILTPDEIDRVLGRRPRTSKPETPLGGASEASNPMSAFQDPLPPLDIAM